VVAESFLFQAVANISMKKPTKPREQYLQPLQSSTTMTLESGKEDQEPQSWGVSPCPAPRSLGMQERRGEKFLLQPLGLPEVGGERQGQEHRSERQKNPQVSCSYYAVP